MNDFLTYILKASAGVAIVALPYYLFLRNDSALKVKRIYLLSGILLSWIFPLLSIHKPEVMVDFQPVFLIDINESDVGTTVEMQRNRLQLHQIIYFIGICLLVFRGFIGLLKIRTFRKNSTTDDTGIYYTNNTEAFTFFGRVFMPTNFDNSDKDSILIHEKAHVRQMHFIDMMIAELNLVFTWFNPFSWLISRMIKENHEHLADRAVLSSGVHPAQYKALLLNHAMGGQVVRFGHQFNQSLTKKRFTMMRNLKTTGKGLLKYAFIIPAILAFNLLTTASCQNGSKTIHGRVYLDSKDVPGTGASVVIRNSTVGTVADKDGKFTLEVVGDPEIVISFVGYETAVRKSSKLKSGPVILASTSFVIPIEYRSKEDIFFNGGGTKKQSDEIIIRTKNESGEAPIYIVDGEIVENVNDLDPDKIAKIEVIKESDNPLIKKHNAKGGLIIVTMKEKEKVSAKESSYKNNTEDIFFVVEDMPGFPGGKEALRDYVYSHLKYPKSAKDSHIEGKVIVQFVVMPSGDLEDVKVIKSLDKDCDKAAVEVFENMPKWEPGMQRGKKISTMVSVPVVFKSSEN